MLARGGSVIALLSALALADGPDTSPPRYTSTVDPLTAALGFAHLQLEAALTERWSLYVGPHLRLYDGILPAIGGPYVGIGAEAGLRVFFRGEAPRGSWVMARGVLARVSTRTPERASEIGGYSSALVGHTFLIEPKSGSGAIWPVISLGAGVSWLDYTVLDYGPRGLAPALHTNLGLAFGR